MKNDGIWYSYTLKPYDLEEESFYNPDDFEWTELLKNNFKTIESDVLNYLEDSSLKPYFNKSLVSKSNYWKTDGLLFWGYFVKKNRHTFKTSWEVLKKIPGIVSISISVLEPGSSIKVHNGDTNAIIRVHLPIIVPEGLPNCSFTVVEETRPWKVGEPLLFNDAHLHKAQNLSNERRVVLLIDVIRPEFLNQQLEICAKVLNGLGWQWQTQSNPNVRELPLFVKKIWWSLSRWILRNALRFNRLNWN